MPAILAHALVPGLQPFEAEPLQDAAALERLGLWALKRYSPVVAVDGADGLVIEATGATHLHGGAADMLADLVERLKRLGLSGRAAMAPTWGAAHAFARHQAAPTLIAPNVASLADLPILALRLPNEIVLGLNRLGFERIGELAAQPRAPLALRFGPDLSRRLDQAFGRLAEPITPLKNPETIEVERGFAEPIGAPETLARNIGLLVDRLCAALETQTLGARRLDLLFRRVDNRTEAIRIGTAKPTRDAGRLTRLLCERLETVEPGFGIERMILGAPVTEVLDYRPSTALGAEPEADLSTLVDTLANRLGAERLYRLAPVESHVPERSVRRIAPLASQTEGRWPARWPRPTRLLSRPEPVKALAELPDRPPVFFVWRGVRRDVVRADGPERIFGEWERRDAEFAAVRDYFHVEDETGGRFWLYRAGDGTNRDTGSFGWFLHGVFS